MTGGSLLAQWQQLSQNNTQSADHLILSDQLTEAFNLPEISPGFGLLACLEGSFEARVNGQSVAVGPDSFIIINEGGLVSLSGKIAPVQPVLLLFRTVLTKVVALELFAQDQGFEMATFHALTDQKLIAHIHYQQATLTDRLKLLLSLSQSCASFQAMKADAVVRSVLKDLTEENHQALQISARLPVVKQATRLSLYQRLWIAREWMQLHFDTAITIEAAAQVAMMNKEHFLRSFKEAFGHTPYQHLMNLRMDKARQQLAETDKSIQQISEEACFEALSSFSYQFRKSVGVSPSAYRKNSQFLENH